MALDCVLNDLSTVVVLTGVLAYLGCNKNKRISLHLNGVESEYIFKNAGSKEMWHALSLLRHGR